MSGQGRFPLNSGWSFQKKGSPEFIRKRIYFGDSDLADWYVWTDWFGIGAETVSLALSVTEAADVAAVTLLDKDLLALAATEAPDVAAITILDKDQLSLAVTEAADTAAVTLLDTDQLALAATEAPDTAAVNLLDSDQLALAATESQDVAAVTVDVIESASAQMFGDGYLEERRRLKRHPYNYGLALLLAAA